MKTFIHLSSLSLLLSLALTVPEAAVASPLTGIAYSSTPASLAVSVIQSVDDKFSLKLIFENYIEGSVSISLLSADGNTVFFKQSVAQNKYIRKFDLYNLPSGSFRIEFKNGQEKQVKTFSISSENGKRVLTVD